MGGTEGDWKVERQGLRDEGMEVKLEGQGEVRGRDGGTDTGSKVP